MPLFGTKQIDKSLDIVDKLVVDKDKKAEMAHELIASENESGSMYTKFARPTIVYFGLFLIFTEIFGIRFFFLQAMDSTETVIKASTAMMEYFLFTWAGITSVYVGGRTYEKAKMKQLRKSKK